MQDQNMTDQIVEGEKQELEKSGKKTERIRRFRNIFVASKLNTIQTTESSAFECWPCHEQGKRKKFQIR